MEETAADVPSGSPTPAFELEPGASIGRYTVLARLGAGAMGVVFSAYDPQLDRKIALKFLVPRRSDPSVARARLQREAGWPCTDPRRPSVS